MPKIFLFVTALLVIVLAGITTLIFSSSSPKPISKSEIDKAINQARYLFSQRSLSSKDLETGPCLSNALMPDWVVDIAHNPRLPADDLPENQCPAFLEGRARHFVELDIEGNLIRAR